DRSLQHPYLLVHAHVPAPRLERHATARREDHLDDLHRLVHVPRRDGAPGVSRGRGAPLRLVGAAGGRGPRARGGGRRRGHAGAAAGASNRSASITPSPPASFSSTTAVGLLSPRSTSEIMERLTPLLLASASSESPRAARSSRTRSAMRSFRSDVASFMMDHSV